MLANAPMSPGDPSALQLQGVIPAQPQLASPGKALTLCAGYTGRTAAGSVCSADDDDADDFPDDQNAKLAVRARIESLPLGKFMMRIKLGNQERRAAELLGKLSQEPGANAVPILDLKKHAEHVQLAKTNHIKIVATMELSILVSNLQILVKAGAVLHTDYKAALFTRTINAKLDSTAASDENMKQILADTQPWGDEQAVFDVASPQLCTLDVPATKKVYNFQKLVMERVLIPMLVTGVEKSAAVISLSSHCLQVFEEIPDNFEVSDTAMLVILDCLICWRAILGITHSFPVVARGEQAQSAEDAILALFEMADKAVNTGSNNIKAMVGKIIQGKPYWMDLAQRFIAERSAWREFETRMHDLEVQLSKAEAGTQASFNTIKSGATLHLQLAEQLEDTQFKSFSALLITAVTNHVAAVMATAKQVVAKPGNDANMDGKQVQEALSKASDLLHDVSTCLPHEVLICDMQNELAADMRRVSSYSKEQSLASATKAILACTGETLVASKDDIIQNLEASVGTVAGQECDPIVVFAKLLSLLHTGSQKHGEFQDPHARAVALQFVHFMGPAKDSALASLQCFNDAYKILSYMHSANAVNSAQAWSFAEENSDLEKFLGFRRCLIRAKHNAAKLGECHPSADNHITQVELPAIMQKFIDIDTKGCAHFFLSATQNLKTSHQSLDKIAGGGQDGVHWNSSVDADICSSDEFMQAAKDTLLADDTIIAALPKAREKLLQDLAISE